MPADVDALAHRIKHMNPRAPQSRVNFGEVPISSVFDLRGFNLNAKLDIDPDFLNDAMRTTMIITITASTAITPATHPPPRARRRCEVLRLPLGQGVQPGEAGRLPGLDRAGLRAENAALQGRAEHEGQPKRSSFQGVHQLMGSDLGPWAPGEKKTSKMVFIGIDLPRDVLLQGLEQCLV
jgi:G3E family GTPase